MLGLYQVDALHKTIELRLSDLPLDWCEGSLPTPAGEIHMRWWKEGAKLCYSLQTPETYQVTVVNLSDKELLHK
ncbi:MAG: hypothetical protein NTY53_18130 [Kiritimatiellaeota bacterium]|nr:hypothetical protein [Kiritimatiellota bacterium]